ncbi:MAG: PilZ domain-containing protein [Candidatus Omnitrophica bacterium]|nr:PilZ domain-containing protein [Candidatus Omnitrophota bacterium]
MTGEFKEQRKGERYDTEVEIYYNLAYDLETRVEYKVLEGQKYHDKGKKYRAVSKNVSIEGLCFSSVVPLERGDKLEMEVFVPNSTKPIKMHGEVRWCRKNNESSSDETYCAGILIEKVEDKPVAETIHYDDNYMIKWSIVLESVLGSYRIISQQRDKGT